jgi:hypothetical protein
MGRKMISLNKKAVIINSIEGFEFAKKNYVNKCDFISDNYLTRVLLNDNKIKYLYNNIHCSGKHDQIEAIWNLTLHWYRDKNGTDLLFDNTISIGPMLSRRGMMAFAMDLKNYYALLSLIKKYEHIYLPNNISQSIKRVIKILDINVSFYSNNNDTALFESTPERGTYYKSPQIHKLSFIARVIQKPFLFFTRKRKVLYIKDWTSIEQANLRTDTIVGNSLNPLKGYYYQLKPSYYEESDKLFPKEINGDVLNILSIQRVLKQFNINWDKIIIQLFINIINEEYIKHRNYFVRSHAIFKETFEYYKPKYVVLPGENEYHSVVVAQLAKMMGIKSVLLIDGYSSYINKSSFFKNENNNDYIFDKYLAQGKANYDLITESGVENNNCIIVSPPICNFQGKKNNKYYDVKIFNVIVMAYLPFLSNILALYDQRIKIETQVLYLLHTMGYKNIGIKIKPGRWSSNVSTELYMKLLKTVFGIDTDMNIEILTGDFNRCIKHTEFIIGGISTAILESKYNDTPYYIYEPFENGKSDEIINSSKIYSLNSIARDLKQLKEIIQNRKDSVTVDKDYLFSGKAFSEVVFS